MDFFLHLLERFMCVLGLHDWRFDIRSRHDNQRFCPTCRSIGTLNARTGKVEVTGKRRKE